MNKVEVIDSINGTLLASEVGKQAKELEIHLATRSLVHHGHERRALGLFTRPPNSEASKDSRVRYEGSLSELLPSL